MKFTFSLPVWGADYVDKFIRHALPSHVAAGLDGDYVVHTDDPSRVIPSLQLAMRQGLKCVISVIKIDPEQSYFQFSQYQKDVYDQSEAAVFLSPDAVIHPRTFTSLRRAVDLGARFVECPGVNTVGGCPPFDDTMGLWARTHLIPTLAGNVWGSDSPDMMCPLTCYFADGDNFWTHAFYHHPLCAVNDGRWLGIEGTTIDWVLPQMYSPRETVCLQGTDALMVELSPEQKFDRHPRYVIKTVKQFADAVREMRLTCHDNLFKQPLAIVGKPTRKYERLIDDVLAELA